MKDKVKDIFIKAKQGLEWFFKSDFYYAFFTFMVILSWALKNSYIGITVAGVTLILNFLTSKSLNRFALVAVVIPAMVDTEFMSRLTPVFLVYSIIVVVLVLLSGVYYFLNNYQKDDRKIVNSKFFIAYVISIVAIALAGVGYPGQTVTKVMIAVGVHLGLLGLYCLLYKCSDENSKEEIAKSIVALGVVMVVEMLIFLVNSPDIKVIITTKTLVLGWAITNSLACMLAVCIPLAFYLAKGKRVQLPYMILGTLFYCAIFLTNCRSMILVGSVVYLATLVVSVIKLNRWQALLNIGVMAVIGIIAVNNYFSEIFGQFINIGLDDNGREELFTYYLSQFKEHPVFGMGFFNDTEIQADGMVRAHNTILQIVASMGIFGVICALYYYYARYISFFKNFTTFKLFAIISYIAMAGYGMFDCAIISSYKLIIVYLLMLAVELDSPYKPWATNLVQKVKLKFKNKEKIQNTTGETA